METGIKISTVCSRKPGQHGYWPASGFRIVSVPRLNGSAEQAEAVLRREFAQQEANWANICFSVGPGILVGISPPRDFCLICGAPTKQVVVYSRSEQTECSSSGDLLG